MAETVSFNEVVRAETAGMWAGVVEGVMPDSPEDMQYFVERTQSGLWAISLKGYNEGEEVPVTGGCGMGFIAGHDETKHQVVSPHNEFLAVPSDQIDDYREAIHQPEGRDDLLVQVFETDEPGIWTIYDPVGDRYQKHDAGLFIRDERARIALGHGHIAACTTHPHHRGRHSIEDAEQASLQFRGALMSLVVSGSTILRLSSIRERTKAFLPFRAEQIVDWGDNLTVREAHKAMERAYGDVESDIEV